MSVLGPLLHKYWEGLLEGNVVVDSDGMYEHGVLVAGCVEGMSSFLLC